MHPKVDQIHSHPPLASSFRPRFSFQVEVEMELDDLDKEQDVHLANESLDLRMKEGTNEEEEVGRMSDERKKREKYWNCDDCDRSVDKNDLMNC